jgi:hypothetical protein
LIDVAAAAKRFDPDGWSGGMPCWWLFEALMKGEKSSEQGRKT